MPQEEPIVSGASTRSSSALPDFGYVLQYLDPGTSKATTAPGMATTTGFTPDRAPPPLPEERERPGPGQPQSSDDSTSFNRAQQVGRSGSLRRDRKPSNASAMEGGQYPPRLDFDFHERDEAPPPQRNPSRQGGAMMRWGPPPTPSDYGYDDERPYYPRPPWDYGRPVPPKDWWNDDPYYNRPYRRPSTIRESVEWRGSSYGDGRGPPRPPRGGRYRGMSEEPSDDGRDSDEQPLRRKPRTKRGPPSSSRSSPAPEIIYRLPFTEWMNRSAKGRTCCIYTAKVRVDADLP